MRKLLVSHEGHVLSGNRLQWSFFPIAQPHERQFHGIVGNNRKNQGRDEAQKQPQVMGWVKDTKSQEFAAIARETDPLPFDEHHKVVQIQRIGNRRR
jgi:hypothetical protein